MTRWQWAIAATLLAFTCVSGIALAQTPGFGQDRPGMIPGPAGQFGPAGPGFGRNPGMGNRFNNGAGDYECSKCKRTFTSATQPSRCPLCNAQFDYVTDENGRKTITQEKVTRNMVALGFICVVVVCLLAGGGIFLLVKLLSGSAKPRKRKKIRRVERPIDDRDDFDDDDDDRPRRRRRD